MTQQRLSLQLDPGTVIPDRSVTGSSPKRPAPAEPHGTGGEGGDPHPPPLLFSSEGTLPPRWPDRAIRDGTGKSAGLMIPA